MGSLNARNVNLNMDDKPTFDPQEGFSYERKPRGISISIFLFYTSCFYCINNAK